MEFNEIEYLQHKIDYYTITLQDLEQQVKRVKQYISEAENEIKFLSFRVLPKNPIGRD
jgi:hypothetical protein